MKILNADKINEVSGGDNSNPWTWSKAEIIEWLRTGNHHRR